MKALKTGLSLLPVAIAIFAFPAAAHSEYLVPPGNSAATQYTEAVPTAGGPKATNNPKRDQRKSPGEVLGGANAKRLEAQGPEGRAAAEVAAATAPDTVAPSPPETPSQAAPHDDSNQGSGSSQGGGPGPGGGAGDATGGAADRNGTPPTQQPSGGSSGLGELVSQATGSSSSGQLGLLLPLIVLAALAWSVAFVLRQRKRPTE